MSMTVELSSEIEARLRRQAALVGMPPEHIALKAIEEKLDANNEKELPLSKEEWHRRFDALIASMPQANLNADLSRDSAYENRGL